MSLERQKGYQFFGAADLEARIAESRMRELELPMPLWPDTHRAAPHAILRSALFGVTRHGRRTYLDEIRLPAYAPYTVTYSGPNLDQSDLDVYLGLLQLARGISFSEPLRFQARSFLKSIGRHTGGTDRQWLQRRLVTMTACNVTITIEKFSKLTGGLLLPGSLLAGDRGLIAVKLNADVRSLFEVNDYSRFLARDRRALGQSQMGKWLHGFLRSHDGKRGYQVARIRDLSGSDNSDIHSFRAHLRIVLANMQSLEIIESWRISDDDYLFAQCPKR